MSSFLNYSLSFHKRSFPLLPPTSLTCFISQKSIVASTEFKVWFGIISQNDHLLLLEIFWRRKDRYFAVRFQVITNIFISWFLSDFNWQITFWETASSFPLLLFLLKDFFLWNSYLIVKIYCMKENQLQDLRNQTKDFKVLCCWGKEGICWERAILWLNIRLYEQILFKSCSGSRKTEKVMLERFIFFN